jgi:hypothetical protein
VRLKKVYILTNFSGYLKSYSPIIVVSEQLKQLTRAGYKPVVIASDGFDPPEDSIFNKVEIKYTVPASVSNDPKEFDESDLEDIENLYTGINEMLPDGAIVLTHDLIFLPDYTKHNIACRRIAQERPSIQWIHWIHSATSPHRLIEERSMYGEQYKELLLSKFPNSIVAFPNSGDIPRVAVNFSYEEDEVYPVPHSTDPTEGMQPIVKRLYDEKGLGEADVIMVFPARLDRGKQLEYNVRVIAQCKKLGLDVRLVICDFQSTGDDKVVYRHELETLARQQEVEEEVIFLSQFDDSAEMESDHQVILDLFQLSNFFMFPSKSETYSLVTQEAMMKGNFCILNYDFAPMLSIYGDHAIYRQFSGGRGMDGYDGEIVTTYGNIDEYMKQVAMNIKYHLINNKVVSGKTFVRRDRNPDAVFRNFLEPLLYRVSAEEVKQYEA